MFSTGQTAVVGVGIVMAAALGFTSAKAFSGEAGTPAAPAPSPSAVAGTPSATATQAEETARTTAAAAGRDGDCLAEVVIQDSWPAGFKAEIRITNRGAAPVENWAATFRLPPGSEITNAWNADLDQDGAIVAAEAPTWSRDLAAHKTATFGLTASGAPEPLPGDVALNGVPCS